MSLLVPGESGLADPLALLGARFFDYAALLKPRVMSLVVFTAFTGMLFAPLPVDPLPGLLALCAIAAGAGAAGALNMWYDAGIDALMLRTRLRPIPAGRLASSEALCFGLLLAAASVLALGLAANWLAAGLLAFTIFFYAVIYTMWLKRRTAQNIVIGGAAGALPPVVGFAAASGHIGLASLVLFLLIFFWTPPHFWALALVRAEDYDRAGIPMLPNVKGHAHTRSAILAYALLLAPLGLLPWLLGYASLAYAAVAALLGLALIVFAGRVYLCREKPEANRCAGQLFGFSIVYLFLLFAALAAGRLLAAAPLAIAG
ncbi:MAG: heme o synthase [Methylocapsa sp.]|nr:heme o synthase [Methylocapsa sp.]